MKAIIAKRLRELKRRHKARVKNQDSSVFRSTPMFAASNVTYELAERVRGIAAGGLGAMHLLARQIGLVKAIDENLDLLKWHRPYHESDHVLNIAFNVLAGNRRLEHLERLRNDENYLDALGADRIPDPTTAGDFCRRFSANDVDRLQEIFNVIRLRVWEQQDEAFFQRAIIDADGTLCSTLGECKAGMNMAYNGEWGFHPLVVSLANTGEPLYLMNRSGNSVSYAGAAHYLDRAIAYCRRGGFKEILLRGDTDFSQTEHLDRWDKAGIKFLFGMDSKPNLRDLAEDLPANVWRKLTRPAPYQVKTTPRARPENHKQAIVEAKEFRDIQLAGEEVAEFDYQPLACRKIYRMVVVRKNLTVAEGKGAQRRLFDEIIYQFYITNVRDESNEETVHLANGRGNQENLIAQLGNGVQALNMPLGCLVSNGAYMVMAALAWSLKAWWALLTPVEARHEKQHAAEKRKLLRMEFDTFLHAVMLTPCQIIRTARRIVFRLLAWNPWHEPFFRLLDRLAVLKC